MYFWGGKELNLLNFEIFVTCTVNDIVSVMLVIKKAQKNMWESCKKQLNISMCSYVRTSVVTYKSAYSDQCVLFFVHCCPSNISQVFSVNISTAFQ